MLYFHRSFAQQSFLSYPCNEYAPHMRLVPRGRWEPIFDRYTARLWQGELTSPLDFCTGPVTRLVRVIHRGVISSRQIEVLPRRETVPDKPTVQLSTS